MWDEESGGSNHVMNCGGSFFPVDMLDFIGKFSFNGKFFAASECFQL
jgi:hypothetical protein